ncbi:hypothetical protein CKAN_01029700 [Cinnamomum micranthum f. kanehirae]|uniref:Uncharacterized protein n=1 Tax=Cinnamomum micranthum f. kanehirae TaxID=337451 RepID=A0A3S3MDG9_9MAGN|nr:hypothetical protein CKAN_01029700 [Cinnamomum micranthum f. kanehirae]
MEEDNQDPFEITSVELNKKRKLQEGQLVLPSPKHKYRERSCDTENESPITDDNKVEDNTDGSQNDSACGGLEPCELVIDSNSFIEESDNAMSVEA